MIHILGTIFAGLMGLAFGSFLNVCLSRWPQGESVVMPGSHCRDCPRPLAWWENVPLVSWIALRGRCRGCGGWIGWRYPLVEFMIGVLWAWQAWHSLPWGLGPNAPSIFIAIDAAMTISLMVLCWLLVAMAVLDAEHLWLPDWLTLPGIVLGLASRLLIAELCFRVPDDARVGLGPLGQMGGYLLSALLGAGLILLIRWLYKLVRHREGLGLGDAKLMALLGAWLGFQGALLSFGIAVVLGAVVGLILLAVPADRRIGDSWALIKLPLGTFLCVGGIISSLWGQQIIAAYLRLAGL